LTSRRRAIGRAPESSFRMRLVVGRRPRRASTCSPSRRQATGARPRRSAQPKLKAPRLTGAGRRRGTRCRDRLVLRQRNDRDA
jgi:hypothetical protein